MPRLIDAESLEDGLHYRVRLYHDEDVQLCVTANQIDATPTIDAVPVVRCGQCEHRKTFEDDFGSYIVCLKWKRFIADDDYCAWGQRREEGDNK